MRGTRGLVGRSTSRLASGSRLRYAELTLQHDLHVSPSLEDLPPAWLASLRAQGLSEQDLLLIASARKRQAAVENTPIRRIKGSDPPDSIHSLPRSVGGSSSALGHTEAGRVRGASTPGTSVISRSSREYLSSAAGESTSVLALPSIAAASTAKNGVVLLHTKFSFESAPSVPVKDQAKLLTAEPEVMVSNEEAEDQPGELMDLGGGRRRTPRKNKRMSDQLRCFSQFDIGGEEGWAASLLSAMNTQDPATTPTAAYNHAAGATGSSTPPITPLKADSIVPKTPERSKTIKRIPIPPMLPPTSPKRPLEMGDMTVPPDDQPWPSSPPPPRRSLISALPTSAVLTPVLTEEEITPVRQSSDSFGVHYSRNQSKSSVDLDLVTPSTSQTHGRHHSPPSSDSGEELDQDVDERSDSDLNFGDVLKETLYDTRPESSVSDRLREFLPPMPSFNDLDYSTNDHPSTRRGARMSHPNPVYSVPASIASSLPSRSSTPDKDFQTPERVYLTLPECPQSSSPTTPVGRVGNDERASMAFSIMSSDSGSQAHDSLHGATLHTAYTKLLNQINEEGKRESGVVGPIAEESEGGDSGSEAGCSAIDALEEAARQVAIRD